MPTTYPYWDADNRYIVSGVAGKETVFAQIFQHPSNWWQVRCYGNRTDCPEKLGPYVGPVAVAKAAIQAHCHQVHFVAPPLAADPATQHTTPSPIFPDRA